MNLLLDQVPESVDIGGAKYAIRTDYRIAVQFEMLMFDTTIPDDEKPDYAINLFYPIYPDDRAEALEAILWFFRCGKPEKKVSGTGSGEAKKIYDYEFDDGLIFSAFLGEYGIDLEAIEHLHWWKYKALFDSLSIDTMFVKVLGYRAADTGKMKGEQREFYEKMQKEWALPLSVEEQDKMNAITDALINGGDLSGVLTN